ncbi:MAG: S8 family serine peptidase, partial [Bacteroidota bacterium]
MKKTHIFSLLLFLLSQSPLIAQSPQANVLRDTDQNALGRLSQTIQSNHATQMQRARSLAQRHGWPMEIYDVDGNRSVLYGADAQENPIYEENQGLVGVEDMKVNNIWPGGFIGTGVTGAGMTLGMWEGHYANPDHVEFGTRINVVDPGTMTEPGSHATRVAGCAIAEGVELAAIGTAYEADMRSFALDNSDPYTGQMATEAAAGLLVSTHSHGGAPINTYTVPAMEVDQITQYAPYYLPVISSGNGGFSWIQSLGNAKNALTVGSADPLLTTYGDPTDITVSNFSSTGPTHGGRMKPEVIGIGSGIYAPDYDPGSPSNNYYTGGNLGTSFATPHTAGTVLLLQELHADLYSEFMEANVLKALVCHTAMDAVTPGPDYLSGYGLVNAQKAADFIVKKNCNGFLFQTGEVFTGTTDQITVNASANGPLRATVVWNDLPGTGSSTQNFASSQINDLNITLVHQGTGTIYHPWVLDPSAPFDPATTGVNSRDNIEQIYVENPLPGAYWLQISHSTTGNGNGGLGTPNWQTYGVVVGEYQDELLVNTELITPSNGTFNSASIDITISGPSTYTVNWTGP